MPRSKPTALRSTLRIESDDPTSLALALKQRIVSISESAARSGRPRPAVRHIRCGTITLATDRPDGDVLAATRAAMRAAGVESATVWAGTSGVEVTAGMDDARLTATALMVAALAAAPASADALSGVPLS